MLTVRIQGKLGNQKEASAYCMYIQIGLAVLVLKNAESQQFFHHFI